MKILMLTPYLPYPLFSGGQTRSFNLIKNLSKNHQITLYSFIRNKEDREYVKFLKPYCRKIVVFQRRPAWSLINILLAGFTLYPFLVVIYLSRGLQKALLKELESDHYDLIHAETFYVMPNIPKTNIPTLLVEQTIEYQVYQHFTDRFYNFLIKPFLLFDVKKVKYWETYYWKKASKVIAVSDDDRNKMKDLIPDLEAEVVPNGIDPNFFSIVNKKFRINKNNTVLYVGNFKWLQNREAVEILIKEIWPKIRQKIDNGCLWIVGRGIDNLKKLERPGIIFDETIDDIRKAYQKADLVLAPIEGPGGTRLKVLEAMASGCPVVTTPVGIEGIEAKDKQEVLIGNSEEELAELTVNLLKNRSLRESMTKRARDFVEKKYSWEKITEKLEKIYQNVCNR